MSETQAEIKPEVHKRILEERDEARQKNQELEAQLLASRKLNQAERFLRTQKVPEEQIPGRLDLLGPHLADVSPEQLDEVLGSERFKPLVTVAAVPTGDDGEPVVEPTTPPTTPAAPAGFAGPSPAGSEPPPAEKRYTIRSPEVQELIRRNDEAGLKELYDKKLIDPPVRNY